MSEKYSYAPHIEHESSSFGEFSEVWENTMANASIELTRERGITRIDIPSMSMGTEYPHALGLYAENVAWRTVAGAVGFLRDGGRIHETKRVVNNLPKRPDTNVVWDRSIAPCEKKLTDGTWTRLKFKSAARHMVTHLVDDTPGSCEITVITIGDDLKKPDLVLSRAWPGGSINMIPTVQDYENMEAHFAELGITSPYDDPLAAAAQILSK